MKTITTTLLILASLLIGCGNATEDDSYDNEQIQTLKAIQSNMSEEEYQYKISAVEEGIKIWKSDIKFEYTESNDKPFLIYFTNRDCFMLPNKELFNFCVISAYDKDHIGFAYPYLDDDFRITNATIILFNDYFNIANSDFNDLTKIVAHEIGHAYGLSHNTSDYTIMHPESNYMMSPNTNYISIMKHIIEYKNIPIDNIDKFQFLPPKVSVTFNIQTLSARTR